MSYTVDYQGDSRKHLGPYLRTMPGYSVGLTCWADGAEVRREYRVATVPEQAAWIAETPNQVEPTDTDALLVPTDEDENDAGPVELVDLDDVVGVYVY